ncbi:hypothetical protein G7046_g9966 [Stylonectria norvegica]|nr:hypothetical protein G7046_g9966 [Stylonectria norvegica]
MTSSAGATGSSASVFGKLIDTFPGPPEALSSAIRDNIAKLVLAEIGSNNISKVAQGAQAVPSNLNMASSHAQSASTMPSHSIPGNSGHDGVMAHPSPYSSPALTHGGLTLSGPAGLAAKGPSSRSSSNGSGPSVPPPASASHPGPPASGPPAPRPYVASASPAVSGPPASSPVSAASSIPPHVPSSHYPQPNGHGSPPLHQGASHQLHPAQNSYQPHMPPQMPPPQAHSMHRPQGPGPPSHGNMPQNYHYVQAPPPQQAGGVTPRGSNLGSPGGVQGMESQQQYVELANAIKSCPPEIVRQVIRDHWEKALLGSQYHIAFLLNATMHQGSAETLSRAVQDFGQKMIKESKHHVMRHLSAEDLDEVASLLLVKVSNNFLDKALARRFETIPAQQLVNALARAERLGYEPQDIVEDKEHGAEYVIPSLHPIGSRSTVRPTPSQSQPQQQPQSRQAPSMSQPIQARQSMQHVNVNSIGSVAANGQCYCSSCGWPCTSPEALEYHTRKHACNKPLSGDRVGKELCANCGCRFGSGGGLAYHIKCQVCGTFTAEESAKTLEAVEAFLARKNAQVTSMTANYQAAQARGTPTASGTGTPKHATPDSAAQSDWVTPGNDPYARLTPDQRREFEKEMKDAEEHYGTLMRQAMQLPEAQQFKQLASLKNRYNTKQSVTRKRYGIRLRERRTKDQIAAERGRLFGSQSGPSLSGRDEPARKRVKLNEQENSEAGKQLLVSPTDSPRKRVPMSEMGGLSGSSATAETTDPTTLLTSSQPRHIQPKRSSPELSTGHKTINGFAGKQTPVPLPLNLPGTQADPMSIDDDSEDDSEEESDSSDDDDTGDIPASLPTT